MSFAQWNAHVHIDGAKAKWIGLGWGIKDYVGDPRCYKATITVTAPPNANAMIGKVGINEGVVLASDDSLSCGPDFIEICVTYHVEPVPGENCPDRGGYVQEEPSKFVWTIAENAGQKGTPTGDILKDDDGNDAEGEALIGEDVKVCVLVPGSC